MLALCSDCVHEWSVCDWCSERFQPAHLDVNFPQPRQTVISINLLGRLVLPCLTKSARIVRCYHHWSGDCARWHAPWFGIECSDCSSQRLPAAFNSGGTLRCSSLPVSSSAHLARKLRRHLPSVCTRICGLITHTVWRIRLSAVIFVSADSVTGALLLSIRQPEQKMLRGDGSFNHSQVS